ncbi:MAG TPA: response regulator [Candidatus Hydrogenedentes bacterium]|nr:response regulator [Candidatus Hydrogenedentota bacterium]
MLEEPRKVLIVDDDESARAFVQAIMSSHGWRTVEGKNGSEGVDLAESEKPDLILLDVTMPVMDGFEAFCKLRSGVFTKDIPIIMLTGINDIAEEERCSEEWMENKFGVTRPEAFIDKPVDANFLLNTIFGVMG